MHDNTRYHSPPPPTSLPLRKRTADQWTGNTRNAKTGTEKSLEDRSLVQRYAREQNADCAGENAARSETSNGTTDDEGCRVRRGTAQGGADFEQEDAREEDPFGAEEGVDTAIEKDEGRGCEHVAGAVPANVVDGVEFVSNFWNSNTNTNRASVR